jgi:hypothetical protein
MCSFYGALLPRGFVFKNAQRGQVILNLLRCGQYILSAVRHKSFIVGVRLGNDSATPASNSVSVTLGPTAQNRLGQLNQFVMLVPSSRGATFQRRRCRNSTENVARGILAVQGGAEGAIELVFDITFDDVERSPPQEAAQSPRSSSFEALRLSCSASLA